MKKLIFCLMFWCCFAHAASCFTAGMSVEQLNSCAKQGDVTAQFSLGWNYYTTSKNYKKAFEWFSKAAEQGHVEAQYNLGVMYGNGEGVPRDEKKALQWYLKSAEQGNAEAQYNLAVRYHEGKGVPRDNLQTYMWINLAALQGKPEAIKNKKDLVKEMTLDQIAEGEKMTTDWLAKHPQKK